jgi:hypothetical protein
MHVDFDTKEVKLMRIHRFMAYKIKSLLYLKNLKWETMEVFKFFYLLILVTVDAISY